MLPQRTVMVQNVLRSVDADMSDDLPVNPLYCILYTLRVNLLAVSVLTDAIAGLWQVLRDVARIEVLFRGSAIVSGSLADIAVMNALLTGRLPFVQHMSDGADVGIAVTVPIYLGRPWMAGMEAFPATRRGELTLHREFASAFSLQDEASLTEQVETWEMLDSQPASMLKYVTLQKTFGATGDQDFDLPMGNPMLGALLFGTTGFDALPSLATWKELRLLVDNVEYMYARANWESIVGELNSRLAFSSDWQNHQHTENLAAAYTVDQFTTKSVGIGYELEHYGYLDFDPWQDGKYALQTAGRGRVHLRAVAGSADLARVLPLEVVSVPGGGAAGA